ncbi:MAG: RraA family protein [Flavobacteriaceae bacterium]|nr:RraA family protein [Flavobacteriaceae bacterium]
MNSIWRDDDELFKIAKKELFVALVGDVLDSMGFINQFLPPIIKPLQSHFVLIGRAMPVLGSDVYDESFENSHNPSLKKPFGIMFEALDSLKAGEVYICTAASSNYALWGGLMSTRAIKLGATGAVLNGWSRDTIEIQNLDFPTFSFGGYSQDQKARGKVIDFNIPIEFGGVKIHPGDIVYGDLDGVLIVPKESVKDAFAKAIDKARKEKLVKIELENGMSSADAFNKFGIM